MSMQKKKSVKRKSPHSEGKAPSTDHSFLGICQSAWFGAMFGMLAAAILLFSVTAIGYATADPCALTKPLALAALYLSSLVAGFATIRRERGMALLCGSLGGLFLMLVFLLLSLLLRGHAEESFQGVPPLLLRLFMLPSAAIGGFLGLPRSTKKRPRTR